MGFANTGRTEDDDSRDEAQLQALIRRKSTIIHPKKIPLLLGIVVLTLLNLRNSRKTESALGVFLHYVDIDHPHPQVRFPPPAEKWLDDFDMDGKAPLCGSTKCLFHSKTNQYNADADQDPHGFQQKEYAYMASQAKREELKRVQRVFSAWEKVQLLSEQFSVEHLFRGPPVPYNCSKSFAKLLNQNSERLVNSKRSSAHYYPTNPEKLSATQLIVQPIELAPKDSILFGCFPNKAKFARKSLIDYFAVNLNQSSTPSPTNLDLLTFNETLEFGYRSTVKMMRSGEGSCMLKDFQVLIDPLSGRIYQFDIERCFEGLAVTKFKFCRNKFRAFVTDLKRCKSGSCHPRQI